MLVGLAGSRHVQSRMAYYEILYFLAAVLQFSEASAVTKIGCDSPKPDFSAPGRRISEEKCRDYNWEKNNIEACNKEAELSPYPYLGLIGFKRAGVEDYHFLCLATLISPNYALTVAHCVNLPEAVKSQVSDPKIVRFGNSAEKAAVDVKILKTIAHPNYKPPNKGYDIGLLELAEEPLLSNFFVPACLWSLPTFNVEQAIVPGRSSEDFVSLTEMDVKLLDRETCERRLAPLVKEGWQNLKEHQLCGDETLVEERMCEGSDGAPAIDLVELEDENQMPYVLGISSFGSLRCEGLSVYTRVQSFIDWIEEIVWSQ